MKLLVTGSKGQLGSELIRRGAKHELLAIDQDELDITNNQAVNKCFNKFCPDAVINAAAYTAVDNAESDAENSFAVNSGGAENLALACQQNRIPLIHISTDYVFNGKKQTAYVEADPVEPLGVYGASKLAGERAVLQYCSMPIIIRTSWVFSAQGNNFVKTILRLGAERDELGIVSDQHGCPTSASELARAIYAVLRKAPEASIWGIYHFCQPEPTTWFGLAEAVFDEAKKQNAAYKVPSLIAINTSDYLTPAKRPANSVLDCSKFCKMFGFSIRPWLESLREVIKELKH